MKKISILNALSCLTLCLLISACATPKLDPIPKVEVKTVPINKPVPIVPSVDAVKTRDIQWYIVTEKNYAEIFDEIKKSGNQPVIFGLSSDGYENLSLNNSDIRALIQQYQKIIAIYEKSYN